jgi:hypothetical protein
MRNPWRGKWKMESRIFPGHAIQTGKLAGAKEAGGQMR